MKKKDEPASDEVRDHASLVDVFRSMDFTETEANLLAGSSIEPASAHKLLADGCTHQLAVRILI